MPDLQSMLESHPERSPVDVKRLATFIEELLTCAQHCIICADSCLAEEEVQMLRDCIRFCLDCADSCQVTAAQAGRLLRGDSRMLIAQIEACQTACRLCADECEGHADNMEHCRLCARACRSCAEACEEIIELMGND